MHKGCKLLVVGPYPKEEGKIQGGVQAVTYYLSEGLAAHSDFEIHVITSVKGISQVEEHRSTAGVNVHLIPLFERFGCVTGFAVDSARIRNAMHSIQPNIVHVHTQTYYPHAALDRGYPSVLTPHGVFFKEADLVKGFMNRVQSRLSCRYEKKALRRARHVILLNHYLANTFGNLINGAQLHYIDNPIDDKFFSIPDKTEPGSILFLGVLLERKGLLHLARAASILKKQGADFRVWVVGPVGDTAYLDCVKQFLNENKLEDNFEFFGLVSEEEVMERYARCSMLVLPSFEETAPMVISQAHAAGKPVVASAVGGIPEMIVEGETSFLAPFGDAEVIAEKIGYLLTNPDKAKRMGQAAKAVAEQRYRRISVVDKTIKVYEEVLANAGKK